MKLLENGNATMGVWLGKNILGQTDEVHHQFEGLRAFVSIGLPSLPPEPPKEITDENTIDITAVGR